MPTNTVAAFRKGEGPDGPFRQKEQPPIGWLFFLADDTRLKPAGTVRPASAAYPPAARAQLFCDCFSEEQTFLAEEFFLFLDQSFQLIQFALDTDSSLLNKSFQTLIIAFVQFIFQSAVIPMHPCIKIV